MKKGSSTLNRTQPRKSKTKSKSKSKSKEKRFDPLQYLNRLIGQFQDHSSSTNKKRGKPGAKRELASAMAPTTPQTERSLIASKVRSKSSYSQYRRKSVILRDPMKIDLNVVTEEDNIHFTESTIKEYDNQSVPLQPIPLVGLTRNAAACKIQRAWRNYQTLKVVKKYYEFYQELLKR